MEDRMLVRMRQHIGGYRNGVEWPDVGGTIEVPDHEADSLIGNGYAEEARDADTGTEPQDRTGAGSDTQTATGPHPTVPTAKRAATKKVTVGKG